MPSALPLNQNMFVWMDSGKNFIWANLYTHEGVNPVALSTVITKTGTLVAAKTLTTSPQTRKKI